MTAGTTGEAGSPARTAASVVSAASAASASSESTAASATPATLATPATPATSRTPAAVRFRALDVFRGATVALMIGVNNPGSWNHLFPPLAHASWHGCTPTDLVFPFFLFAVGNALAFVMPGFERGPSSAFWAKLFKRTLLIFLIGLLLNAAPFVSWGPDGTLVPRTWENLRLMGVLQRIALAWCGAALILRFAGLARALPVAAVLLLAYWALCIVFGAPGDPYSLEGFFGTHLDRALLGPKHLYRGEGVPFDPEGLGSTLPAVAQVLLGAWVGDRLRRAPPSFAPASFMHLADLFVAACAFGVLAWMWQLAMPLNKKIWTSSYVLLTTGLAIATIGLLVRRLDLSPGAGPEATPLPGWARFFEVFGKNALFVYVMSGLIPRLDNLLRWQTHIDEQGRPRWLTPMTALARALEPITPDPRLGSLLFALVNVAAYWALAAWLDRRRVYIKV
jgi:predicted acyltransferase